MPLAGALHGRPPPWSERLLAARDGWQGTLRPRESRAHLCRRREGRATRGRRVAYPSPARCCHRTRELTCSGGAGGGGTGRRRHRTIGHLAAQERLGSARVPLRGDDELADVAARPIDAQYDDRRADGRRQHALHIAEVLGTAKGEQRVAHLEAGFARRRARRGRVRDDAKGAHAGRRRSEHLGRRLVRRHAGLLRRRASTESDREERGEETTGAGGYRRLPTCLGVGTVRAPYSCCPNVPDVSVTSGTLWQPGQPTASLRKQVPPFPCRPANTRACARPGERAWRGDHRVERAMSSLRTVPNHRPACRTRPLGLPAHAHNRALMPRPCA